MAYGKREATRDLLRITRIYNELQDGKGCNSIFLGQPDCMENRQLSAIKTEHLVAI